MRATALVLSIVLGSGVLLPSTGAALTVAGFRQICESAEASCESLPVLQAYVGGSLDMIATLDERTEFLGEVYCRPPSELFDVAAIIRYVERAPAADEEANAMSLVVRYLVEKGGC